MHAAFGIVLLVVVIGGAILALVLLLTNRGVWEDYGRRGMVMERETRRAPAPGSSGAVQERDEEIRQMLEARNQRRQRRGEAPLDIEEELSRLTLPTVDDELRAEIRELVLARNHRRARRGQPPLDVEAEIEREIAELGGG
jgi:parvulin-like peptidyl-prolyl isomerase